VEGQRNETVVRMAAAGGDRQRRCLYEVLDVERNATPDEIKQAFRKAALKWHPDKNADRLDEATEVFKEITNAHSILSDPNERAWYDSHREQILRGGDGTGEAGEGGEGVDLYEYFSSSCYSGYGDDEGGFYAVYRSVFEKIEELEKEDIGSDEYEAPPLFGDSTTPWTSGPGRFYTYYDGFSTRRAFAWCDMYNPNEAPNRQVKRAIEKENQKERNKAKRAFNENVRRLAAWIKKRDPRQVAFMRQVEEEKAKKEEERRLRELEHRKKRAEAIEAEKEKDIEVDENMDDWYLEMELMQQLKGKKGKKKLREELLAMDRAAVEAAAAKRKEEGGEDEDEDDEDEDEDAEDEEMGEEKEGEVEEEEESEEEESEEESVLEQLRRAKEKKKNKKKKVGPMVGALDSEEEEEEGDGDGAAEARKDAAEKDEEESEEEDEVDVMAQMLKARQKKKNKKKKVGPTVGGPDSEEEPEAEVAQAGGEKEEEVKPAEEEPEAEAKEEWKEMMEELEGMGFSSKSVKWALRHTDGDMDAALGYLAGGGEGGGGGEKATEKEKEEAEVAAKKLKGKKAKEAKKAANAQKGGGAGNGGDGEGETQVCNVCKATFPSRSKLFNHIKETGHALFDPRNPASTPKQMKAKKKR